MKGFNADAFLDSIRASREVESVETPSKPPNTNVFDADDFLHSIHLARQIEELEETREGELPLVVESPSDIE